MDPRKAGFYVALILVAMAGCATVGVESKEAARAPTAAESVDAPAPPGELRAGDTPLNRQWVFTEINGFQGKLPPATNASLHMGGESGRVVGTTSCNPISGSFEIEVMTGKLRFENLENGSHRCKGTNARTEEAVIQAMIATDAFVLQGPKLSLISKGHVVAHLVTP